MIMLNFDINKSLWELCEYDSSTKFSDYRSEGLSKKPLKDLEYYDLVSLLYAWLAPQYTVPLAIDFLQKDPFDDPYFSLLCSLLNMDSRFWDKNPNLRAETDRIFQKIWATKDTLRQTQLNNLLRAHLMFCEFGPVKAKIDDYLSGQNKHMLDYILSFLAIIACRQAISEEELFAIMGGEASCLNPSRIEFLKKERYIQANYEGPFPSPLIYRLTKEFRKKLGLSKKTP